MRLFRNKVRNRERTISSIHDIFNILTYGSSAAGFLLLIQLFPFLAAVGGVNGDGGVSGSYLNLIVLSSSVSSNLASFLVIYSALPHFASAKSIRNGKESSTELPLPMSVPQTQINNQSSSSSLSAADIDPTLFASRTLQIVSSGENGTTAVRSSEDTSPSKTLMTDSDEGVDSSSWEEYVEKTLKEFEKSKKRTEELEQAEREGGSNRLKRQMAQEIALIAPVLATAGCIPKFFCGMNSKPPSEKTSTLNDLAYLIKVAMLDDDDVDIDDALFPEPGHNNRGKDGLGKIKDDLIIENMAEEELIQEDPANIRWVSVDMENRIKVKPGNKHQVRLDDELMDAIIVEPEQTAMGHLLTGIKSVFRIGRSVPVPKILSELTEGVLFKNSSQVMPRSERRKRGTRRRWKKKPFWATPQFRQDMELAERIGKTDQDDERCSTTFKLCPYTTHEMMDIVHGGYAQKMKRKRKKKPQWFMNNEGPPEDSSEEEPPRKKFKDPDNLITTTTEGTKWYPNDPEQQLYYSLFPNKAVERGVTTVPTTKRPPVKFTVSSTTPMSITTESEHEYEDLILGLREQRRPPMKIQGHVEYENDDEASSEVKNPEHLDVILNNKKREQQSQLLQRPSWWKSGNRRPPPPPPPPHLRQGPPSKPSSKKGKPRNKEKPESSEEDNNRSNDEDDEDNDDENDNDDNEDEEEQGDTSSEEQVKKKVKRKKQQKKKKESNSEENRSMTEEGKPEVPPSVQPIRVVPTQPPTLPPDLLPQNLEYAQIIIVEDHGANANKQTVEPHHVQQLQPFIESISIQPTPKPPPVQTPRPKYKIVRVKPKPIKKFKKDLTTSTSAPPPPPPPVYQPQAPAQPPPVSEQKQKKKKVKKVANKSKEVSKEEEEEEEEESQENSSEEKRTRFEQDGRPNMPRQPPQPIPPQNGRLIVRGRPSEEVRDHRMNPGHGPNRPQMSAEENEDNSGDNSNESGELAGRPPPHPHNMMRNNISHEYTYSDEMEGHRPQLRPIQYSYFKKRPRDEQNQHGNSGPPAGPPSGPPQQQETTTQKYSTGFLGFLFGKKDKNKRPSQHQQQQQHQQRPPQFPPPGAYDDDNDDDDDDDDNDDNEDESNERQDLPPKTINSPDGQLEVGHVGRPPPKSIKPDFTPPEKPQRPYKGSTSMEDSDEKKHRTSPPPTTTQQTQPPRPLLFLGKPHRIVIPPPATPPPRSSTPPPTLPYSTHSTEKPTPKDSDEEPESDEEKTSDESKEDEESKEDNESSEEKTTKKKTTVAPQNTKKKAQTIPLPPIANYGPTAGTTYPSSLTPARPSSSSSTTSMPSEPPSKKTNTKTRTDYNGSDEQNDESKQDDSEEQEDKKSQEVRSGEESDEDNSSEEKNKRKSTVPPHPKRKPEDDELEHPSAQFPPLPPVVGDIAAVEQILGDKENEDEIEPYNSPSDNIPAPPPLALQGFPTALEIVVPTNPPPIKVVAPGSPLYQAEANSPFTPAVGPVGAGGPPNQPGPGVPLAGFNQNAPGGGQGVVTGGGTSFSQGGAQTFQGPGGGIGPGNQNPPPGPQPGPAAGPNEGSEQGFQAIRNPISTSSGNRQPGNLGNRRPGQGNRRPGQQQQQQGNRNPEEGNRENEKENSSEEDKNSSEEKNEKESKESSEETAPAEESGLSFDGFDEAILSLGFQEEDDDDDDGERRPQKDQAGPPPAPPIFIGGTSQKEQAHKNPFLPRPVTPSTPVFYRPGFKQEPINFSNPPPPPPPPPPHHKKHPLSPHPLVLPMRPSAAANLTPFIKRPPGGPTNAFSVSHLLRPLMSRPWNVGTTPRPLDPKVVQWIKDTYGIPDLNSHNSNRRPPPHLQPNRSGEHGDKKQDEKSEDSSKKRIKIKRKERPTHKKDHNKSVEKVSSTLAPTPALIILSSRHSTSAEKMTKPMALPTKPTSTQKTTPLTTTTTTKSTTTSKITTTSPRPTTTTTTTTRRTTTTTTQPTTTTTTSTTPSTTTSKVTTTTSQSPPKVPPAKKEEIKAKHSLSKLPSDYVTEEDEAKMAQALFSSEESAESEEASTEAATKSKVKTKVGHTKLTITVKSVLAKDKAKSPSSMEKIQKVKVSSSSSESHKKRKPSSSSSSSASTSSEKFSSSMERKHKRPYPSSREKLNASLEKMKSSHKHKSKSSSSEIFKRRFSASSGEKSKSSSTEIFKRRYSSSSGEKKKASSSSSSSSGEKKKASSSSSSSSGEVKVKFKKSPLLIHLPSMTTPMPSTTSKSKVHKLSVEIRTTKKPQRPQRIKLPPIYGKHSRRVG